ncbi:putative leader peptide [Planomonospora sp. ID91781]|uniref:putative leader peptide n=1 Tax=Planomonospora sp. ID91781 TaxID=2738135 RepID=UPI0035A8AF93
MLTIFGRRTYGVSVTTTVLLTTRGHVDLCRVASALCPPFRLPAHPLSEGSNPCHPSPSPLSRAA